MDMKTQDLARFLEASVKALYEGDENSTYYYQLDNELGLYVGWGGGFDEGDEFALHSKSYPSYCVCAKIAEWNATDLDYEWLYMPHDVESGDVWDTDNSISPSEDYEVLVGYFMGEYGKIREGLDSGALEF